MFFPEYLPWCIHEKVKPVRPMWWCFFLLHGCLQSNSIQKICFSPLPLDTVMTLGQTPQTNPIWLCQLLISIAVDTCPPPPQEFSRVLLQLLTFSTPWKKLRMEVKNEAPCILGKTGSAGFQIIRYFQEKTLWAQFLYLFTSQKALKSFTDICSSWLAEHFTRLAETSAKNMC